VAHRRIDWLDLTAVAFGGAGIQQGQIAQALGKVVAPNDI